MKTIARLSCFSLVVLLSALSASSLAEQSFQELRQEGYIVVSPEGPTDGGDFGPNTPNTKTAGIQEALDHAKTINTDQHRKVNVFVAGGRYQTHETIRIPWMGERFRFQAAETWIDYQEKSGDVVTVDSQMNCRFHFGYVSGLFLEDNDSWLIRVKPLDPALTAPLPKERQEPAMVSTLFEINALVSRGWFKEGVGYERGNGIILEATEGPILWTKVDISELNTCSIGVELKGKAHCNTVDVWFNHGCNTHIQLDEGTTQNTVIASINSEAVPESAGVRLFGSKNTLHLTASQTAPGKLVIFEEPASDNVVHVTDLALGYTNNAKVPTNRILSNTPQGFAIETQDVPAPGEALVNRYPGTVQVTILDAGEVSKWALIDSLGAAQTIDGALTSGQQILLEPGDSIRMNYTDPPEWKWRSIR